MIRQNSSNGSLLSGVDLEGIVIFDLYIQNKVRSEL